ncbi:MAG TPA: ABC transporter permease [Candidatus Bathyarchaeia archaeon]|nr:ABC transporter permease [Candidatus Bathyarchaeia archaeon]
MLQRIVENRAMLAGCLIIFLFVFTAIFTSWLSPFDPFAQSIRQRLRPPGDPHWLGTDGYGRDILSRIIWGSRISLTVGVVAVAIGATLGILVGLVAGFFGGGVDNLLMRIIDILLVLPTILLSLVIVAMLGAGVFNLMIAVGIANAPRFARVIRAEVLAVKQMVFVNAASALGASSIRLMARHILPNILASILVLSTLRIAQAITTEASLSFLGLGVPPPTPTWGSMIADGRIYLRTSPWVAIIPGIMIMLIVMAFNLFGDGLRDLLDPKLRGSKGRE